MTWHRFQAKYAPYFFVAPFLIIFGTFGVYPILKSVVLSLHITAGVSDQVFVGLDNFRFMVHDPNFHTAVLNTILFAAASVGIQLPLALGLAVFLNSRYVKGRNLFRFAFFSPYLMGPVFASILFTLVFAENFGLLNTALHALFGSEADRSWLQISWLGAPENVMPALVILATWLFVGFNMIYFLAALQAVDRDLYEAAEVDGANALQRFRHVTVPGIKPVIVFVLVFSTIGSFKVFELPWLLLGNSSGPDQSGLFVVTYLYQNGFITGDLGYASAIGWTLTAGVLLISLVQVWLSGTMRREA